MALQCCALIAVCCLLPLGPGTESTPQLKTIRIIACQKHVLALSDSLLKWVISHGKQPYMRFLTLPVRAGFVRVAWCGRDGVGEGEPHPARLCQCKASIMPLESSSLAREQRYIQFYITVTLQTSAERDTAMGRGREIEAWAYQAKSAQTSCYPISTLAQETMQGDVPGGSCVTRETVESLYPTT